MRLERPSVWICDFSEAKRFKLAAIGNDMTGMAAEIPESSLF